MRHFQYLAPRHLNEALALLTPDIIPLAGGTDLFLGIERLKKQPKAVIDLKRIPDMDRIESSNGRVSIGTLTLMDTLANSSLIQNTYRALAESARAVGSTQTRNRATLGGNLANASPAADTATPLMALGAAVLAADSNGTREIPTECLFVGPGKTALREGELLTAILIPTMPIRAGSSFQRCTRTAMDIALVNCAAFVQLDENESVIDARIALGAVGPTPLRAVSAEHHLKGQKLTSDITVAAAAFAADDAKPIDDVRASAIYRKDMVRVLTQRAIDNAFQRARREA